MHMIGDTGWPHFSDYGFPSNTELRPGHRTWDYG